MSNAHFLISAPSSNSGKTTVTLGLLRALRRRGLKVQPFKCGPDYIDPIHHTQAAGNLSVNLDTFMSSESHARALYNFHAAGADVSVAEGVMGLFDGADKMQGSSAAIAELLDIPVILVVDARSMAYSAAPLLFGFKNFYTKINVAGVIFNFVSTESHYRFLKDACTDAGVEALGYLPKDAALSIPSRHLGLHISSETDFESIIESAATAIEKTINLDRLLDIAQCEKRSTVPVLPFLPKQNLRITIARDEAFAFTYHENIQVLSGFGEIKWFSPLRDKVLPETDFLYLPGGYPELYANQLSGNRSMRDSIKAYCENGGLTFAECGGLMYLGKSVTDGQGDTFEMVGALECDTTMQSNKMMLGYRIAHWEELEFRGHEFHYSDFEGNRMNPLDLHITNAKGSDTATQFYRYKNTFASYMHVYWGDNTAFLTKIFSNNTHERN